MKPLEALVESWQDLLSQEIDLPEGGNQAEEEMAWYRARVAAMKSIARSVEDEPIEDFQEEVDRTHLLNSMRQEITSLQQHFSPDQQALSLSRQLESLSSEPMGVQGALALLRRRRERIGGWLTETAETLGYASGTAAVIALQEEGEDGETGDWGQEWGRAERFFVSLELPLAPGAAPALLTEPDRWSLPVLAVRGVAIRLFEQQRAKLPYGVRRQILAPGLLAGWGRTVASLLRRSQLFEMPEQQLMLAWRDWDDALAGELGLQLLAGRLSSPQATEWAEEQYGGFDAATLGLLRRVRQNPADPLAAALAYEEWLNWHRATVEGGSSLADFLRTALLGGGLPVHLARWAAGASIAD